ncbi:hypothetical protein QVD17_27916 [Tagetes erecta]|uniref:PHD-type zinc finger plants domain-containing protein n=1 Tax=Tagetes erecta TaxID=13708 RepID=A0AAD8K9V5_TARER|nr:hypothetical protein QVD17_27916 [Tagetes erecta]
MDVERVCCMCGDVGFPDKIFRCINCHHRFQHMYCSNSYNESTEPTNICDWCQTDDEIQTFKSMKPPSKVLEAGMSKRSEYLGNKTIKQQDREEGGGSEKGKPPTGAPSPRTSTRRYKLLKDVMC